MKISKTYGYGPADERDMVVSGTAGHDGIEFGRLFQAIWQMKWLIIGSTFLFAALFFVLLSRIEPQYTARASVMLDPRSVQVLSSDNVVSDLNLNNPVLDTEVAVLRSNVLLEEVVRAVGVDEMAPLDPANAEPSLIARQVGWLKGLLSPSRGGNEAPAGQAAPGLSPEERQLRRLVGALRRSMTVWREGQSYLISLTVETPDPALSTTIANQVVESYIAQQITMRTDVVRNATTFLEERVQGMRAAVEEAESRIEDFRSNQLEQAGISSETVSQQMLELGTQLALAQADLAQVRARYDRISSVIERDGIQRAAELLTSPFVLSLRQQLSEAGREEAELATRYSPDYEERVEVRAEIARLEEDLASEVRQIVATLANDAEVAEIRVQSIRSSLQEMESRSAELSRASLELRQLEREAEAVRENYQAMLIRLSETRSTEQLQRADARQVERAVIPGAPSSPRVMLFTVFGATLGFAIGLLATFLIFLSRSGFGTAKEVEEDLGLPVLTTLLKQKWKTPQEMLQKLRDAPYQPFAERLRQLRMMLVMRRQDKDKGVAILLTSSVAGESKTSTALALAHLEALAKRRCVVLDFDLRRSHLKKSLGYEAKSDLAGVLLEGRPVSEAIYSVPDLGFDLVSLREPLPQLVDLADHDHLRKLFDDLKARYDTVLVDTAPLLLVADTLRLASLADLTLLLVRQKETKRSAVADSARSLEEMGARQISVVMTMADPRQEQDSYGYYG